jgi:C4-dicarboxylate-specific signal transduction histidine kinase
VAAVVFTGLAAVDVAFVFWGQSQLNRLRHGELRNAALATALALAEDGGATRERLDALAAKHSVELVLVGAAGERMATSSAPAPKTDFTSGHHVVVGGIEQVAVRAVTPPWQLVVASRPIDVTRVLEWQRPALLFLALLAAVMVALALWLMRRAVLSPVQRMTQLVGAADRDGLSRFGLEASDGFARLSSAIVGMTQRIEDDRVRIRGQLDELQAAHAELRATQQQLVRAERLAVVGQLAAGLAHEIGNPLAVLSGYVDVLREPGVPAAERDEALARMARELDRIHIIMRDLLDFSRAPAAAAGAGDVGAALQHVGQLLAPQERFRGVDLEVDLPAALPAVAIETDALTQVLLNLMLNAADAMGGSGRVRVTVEVEEDALILVVDDSGPGIAADVAASIFEPFFTTKAAGEGTGLGLAVCDHIVSAGGGGISLAAGTLGGACFRVKLPAAAARA